MQGNENYLVWARMRFFPFWPAKVVEPPPIMGRAPANKVCVLFFGTKEFGFVERDKIMDYKEHRQKFIGKGRGMAFINAVNEMDEYLSDPIKFRSHGFARLVSNQVPIKSEREVERRLNIKTEHVVGRRLKIKAEKPSTSEIQKTNDAWHKEKQTLIQQICSLKSESHRNVLSWKRTRSECDTLLLENKKLKKDLTVKDELFSRQMNEMKLLLNQNEVKFNERKEQDERIISDLKRDNKLLLAQIKQYKTGMMQQNPVDKKNETINESAEYEVEAILDHKLDKNHRYMYLVHWKGYDSGEDTWEKESNLHCPKILKKYKRSIANFK